MKSYKNRAEVPEKYKWDLTEFFASNEELNQSFKEAEKLVAKLKGYYGCTKSIDKLYEFIKLDEKVSDLVENLYAYTYLVNDQELGNSKSIDNKAKAEKLITDYSANTAFFAPELLKLSSDEYNALFKDKRLINYRPMLDDIYRTKEHILSENEESLITNISSSMDHFEDISSNLLNNCHNYGTVVVNNKEETLTPTNYRIIMKSDDRDFRKRTQEQFCKVLDQYGTISASLLDSFVKARSINAKIHNYASSWDSKLFLNNMPNEVYNTLVKNVESSTKSYQRYLKLLKSVHNIDILHTYDLNLNLAKLDKDYSIEEAQDLVFKAISVFGPEYQTKFKKIYDERYIDYACYKGKCSGGYSLSTMSKNSRILMSYNGDLSSVSTIAHEGGHNVHHQFVKENNDIVYRSVGPLVSEVASLTNECLLSSYLAKYGETKEEKLAGIGNMIEVINSNLFGAVREGKMEEDFYKLVDNGGTITKEYMDNLTLESLKKYYGNLVELDKYSNISWVRRSHYYMFFYLYAYAICISIASFVTSEILNGNKEMLDNYIKFLSTGSDKWPIEAFNVLGIDLTKDDVYQGAIKYYNSLIDEFERIRNEE